MKKGIKYIAMMLATMAGIVGCNHEDPEFAKLSKTEKEQRQAINIFAYNTMSTYYLWSADITSELSDWKMLEDPVEKVKKARYKDSSGKDIDKWTVLTDDIEKMKSSTAGVSTTYGMDFKLFWFDASQTAVCLVVTVVYPDSPAEKAGLKRGDIIVKIGGKGLTGDNYSTLLYDSFLNAKSCTLTDMDSKEYKMTAVEMYENPVLVRKVFDVGDKKVGYLFFNSFTLAACQDLIEAGKYFRSEGIESLILDMRYNGGGYVVTETALASMLAPEAEVKAGSVFETVVYNSTLKEAWGEDDTCFSETITYEYGGKNYSIDLSEANFGISRLYAIMTGDSASASESLLVGLMPYMDVRIFGQQSYGKYCSGIMYSAKDWYKDYDEVLEENQRDLGKRYAAKWGIYVMVGRYADKNGNTPCMPDGFKPDYVVEDRPVEPYQLGDEREAMLAAVLAQLRGSETTPHSAARSAAAPVRAIGPEIARDRGPAYGAHVLLK